MIPFLITLVIAVVAGFGVSMGVVLVWEWIDRRYGFPHVN